MSGFGMDTSGSVEGANNGPGVSIRWSWSDLSPFAQGYVEAMFQTPYRNAAHLADGKGFSGLAPETLARIMEDCARGPQLYAGEVGAVDGADFWARRQRGDFLRFPWTANLTPLTPYLGDDGKVYLREGV